MARRPEDVADVSNVDLSGCTVLVTGSTSGIGKETALALGRLGASVLVHGRDQRRGDAVVETLHALGVDDARFFQADFERRDDVVGLADAVRDAIGELDVLVNNAGAYFREGRLTDDGVERTIAVNHLAPFLLTVELLPSLPDDGRVVTVASDVHRSADLDLDSYTSTAGYDGLDAYRQSKLANVLFSAELARRLDSKTANCVHPGFVPGSGLYRESSLPVRALMTAFSLVPSRLSGGFVVDEARGAATSVYVASSPDVESVTGAYLENCKRSRASRTARDPDAAKRVWTLSEELAGLSPAETPSG